MREPVRAGDIRQTISSGSADDARAVTVTVSAVGVRGVTVAVGGVVVVACPGVAACGEAAACVCTGSAAPHAGANAAATANKIVKMRIALNSRLKRRTSNMRPLEQQSKPSPSKSTDGY